MKYCEKCGKQLKDEDLFCEKCGAPSKPLIIQADKSSVVTAEKKNKMKAVIIVALLLVVVALTVVGFVFSPMLFRSEQGTEDSNIESTTASLTTVENFTTVQPSTQAPTAAQTKNEYILPDSDKTKLSNKDLADLSEEEIELARNEIYARRGRKFDTDYIQEYFNSQSWYNGTINPDDSSEDMLNEIEKYNINLISDYEDKLSETSSDENRVSFGSYSLELPDDWTYDITDDGVYFYEKYNYTHEETGSTGLLCAIISTTNSVEEETSDYLNSSLLGSKYGNNYFLRQPMVIGIIEDETAQQKYHDALNEVNDVMEIFQFE